MISKMRPKSPPPRKTASPVFDGVFPPPPAPVKQPPCQAPQPTTPPAAVAVTRPTPGLFLLCHEITYGATLRDVAGDFRNMAAAILIVCCPSSKQAESLGHLLSELTFGTALRGDGEGRNSKEEYQHRFSWYSKGKYWWLDVTAL